MRDKNNWAEFVGTIGEDIRFHHREDKNRFYKVVLHVQRLSGVIDEIPMLVTEKILKQCDAHKGLKVSVEGRVQRNCEYDEKRQERHVKLYIHVTKVERVSDTKPDKNDMFLSGDIFGSVILRRTPNNRAIAEFSIICTIEEGKKSYRIWCIAWGNEAYSISEKREGDRIALRGRFQSRYYIKVLENGEEEQRITYEVSTMKMIE